MKPASKADYEKALVLYQDVLKFKPRDTSAMRTLSWTYYKLQRYTEAQEMAMKLTDIEPADPIAWQLLGRMQEANGELESAVRSYEMSLKLDPKQIEVQGQLGRLYVRLRDLDRGIEFLERVRKSGKAAPSIYPLLVKRSFIRKPTPNPPMSGPKPMPTIPPEWTIAIRKLRRATMPARPRV